MTDLTERGLPERVARNREIARLRDGEKLAWEAIASRLSVSVRTATRGYGEHHRSAALGTLETFADVDVEALVMRLLRAHVRALDRMDEMAEQRGNQNASIGAARTVGSLSASLVAVLGRTGLLPESGGRWALSREAEQIAQELADACRRRGVPAEVIDDVCGVADAAAVRLNPQPALAGSAVEGVRA
jgi:hypothetical protein